MRWLPSDPATTDTHHVYAIFECQKRKRTNYVLFMCKLFHFKFLWTKGMSMMYKHLPQSQNGTARAANFERSCACRATGATSTSLRSGVVFGPEPTHSNIPAVGITESQEEQ